MEETQTQVHFCTISDRFVVNNRLTVEITFEYHGAQTWHVTASMVGNDHNFFELYTERHVDPLSIESMMALQRKRVAALLGIAVSRVGVKNDVV